MFIYNTVKIINITNLIIFSYIRILKYPLETIMNKFSNELIKKTGLLTFLVFLIFPSFLNAQMTDSEVMNLIQNESEQIIVAENSRMMQEGFMFHAEMLADKLLTFNSESSNYNYRKGYVTLILRNDHLEATPYLEKAILDTDPNFDAYSSKEKSAPIDAYFHLGKCSQLADDIAMASTYFSKFISEAKIDSELSKEAKLRLIQCANALKEMDNPVRVELINLGKNINTSFSEYSPVVSANGASLYFTARRPWKNGVSEPYKNIGTNEYTEDIYRSNIGDDSVWSNPVKLDFCRVDRNEATVSISSDEGRVYVYQDKTGGGDIYYSDFTSNKFSEIKMLESKNYNSEENKKINSEYWESHLFVNHDGDQLFFSSDRPGGFGGKDIYYCKKEVTGSWSTPINLGPKINSENDEDSPFLSIDNKMLYFSSNGSKSIGGFDILTSTLDETNTWSYSKNIGYPFNSTSDDIFYSSSIDGLSGFVTSSRKGGMGNLDIYEIKNDFLSVKSIAVLNVRIKSMDNTPLSDAASKVKINLKCKDCDESDKSVNTGLLYTGLKPGKTYIASYINSENNVPMYEETFVTNSGEEIQEIQRDFKLDPKNKTLTLIDKNPSVNQKPIVDKKSSNTKKSSTEKVKELETVYVKTHKNLEYLHYFDYNRNKINPNKADLKSFLKEIEQQLKDGREQVTINIYSSASQVPTNAFESNQRLSEIRAENLKYDIMNYFERKSKCKGKVNVAIVTTIVDGPEYVKDGSNRKKYLPYQFVGLKTE